MTAEPAPARQASGKATRCTPAAGPADPAEHQAALGIQFPAAHHDHAVGADQPGQGIVDAAGGPGSGRCDGQPSGPLGLSPQETSAGSIRVATCVKPACTAWRHPWRYPLGL